MQLLSITSNSGFLLRLLLICVFVIWNDSGCNQFKSIIASLNDYGVWLFVSMFLTYYAKVFFLAKITFFCFLIFFYSCMFNNLYWVVACRQNGEIRYVISPSNILHTSKILLIATMHHFQLVLSCLFLVEASCFEQLILKFSFIFG